jgi:hypothetical protein
MTAIAKSTKRKTTTKTAPKDAGEMTWAEMERVIEKQVKQSSKTLKILAKL